MPTRRRPPGRAKSSRARRDESFLYGSEPWKNIIIAAGSIAAALVAIATGWSYFGFPKIITDHALTEQVTVIRQKIDESKEDVTKLANKNKDEVQGDVTKVATKVDTLAQRQEKLTSTLLETQMTTLTTAKQRIQDQLVAVNSQITKSPNDPLLQSRKNDLTNYFSFLDDQLHRVQDQFQKAKEK